MTFKRFKDTIRSQNSRVENLLGMMGIEGRLISEENLSMLNDMEQIDFDFVARKLNPFINESKGYLINALG